MPFDPELPDCFFYHRGLTDDEVTALIVTTKEQLERDGEYDQDDIAALKWDAAHDLVIVAEQLWAARQSKGVRA